MSVENFKPWYSLNFYTNYPFLNLTAQFRVNLMISWNVADLEDIPINCLIKFLYFLLDLLQVKKQFRYVNFKGTASAVTTLRFHRLQINRTICKFFCLDTMAFSETFIFRASLRPLFKNLWLLISNKGKNLTRAIHYTTLSWEGKLGFLRYAFDQ